MADIAHSRIAVQHIQNPGRWFVIALENVAYAFLGSAVSRGVVAPVRGADGSLLSSAVYVRTLKGNSYRTGFSTLDGLRQRLNPARFVRIHRHVMINIHQLVELDLATNASRVGVKVGDEVVFLPVSRRHLRLLRSLVVLPRRVQRAAR